MNTRQKTSDNCGLLLAIHNAKIYPFYDIEIIEIDKFGMKVVRTLIEKSFTNSL